MSLQQAAKITVRLFASLGTIATGVLAIYAARPWGDNYAYQEISDYVLLAGFVVWALSPYIYLFFFAGRRSARLTNVFGAAVAVLICVVGTAVVFDTVFIHPDAQGGLIFLFMPAYQWLGIGALELILVVTRARNAM